MSNPFHVTAVWDGEANVWVAESEDVPGLITEAGSETRLIEKLSVLVPELLALNPNPKGPRYDPHKPLELVIVYQREAHIRLPHAAA